MEGAGWTLHVMLFHVQQYTRDTKNEGMRLVQGVESLKWLEMTVLINCDSKPPILSHLSRI